MTELAVIEAPVAPTLDIGAWGDALVFADRMALAVSDTEFVPGALRGRPQAVTALILYGMEIGVTPMQALQGMHIVDGRPAPSAELMRALIYRAGHTVTIHEATGTRARVSGLRKGRPESERYPVEWTIDMARAAGLLGRKAWQQYPRAMLIARATGDLARALFPDVIKGLGYVAEEAATDIDGWGAPEALEPEPKPRAALQRKRRQPRPPSIDDVPLPEEPPGARQEPETAPVAPEATAEPGAPRRPSSVPIEPPHKPAPTRVADEDRPLDDEAPAPVFPHTEPERPGTEPPPNAAGAGPPLLAAAPMRALQAGLTRELGTVSTREERHALVAAILGREILTTKELTRSEGLKVLDWLGRFESGTASFEPVFMPDDKRPYFKVYDLRPEPKEE